METGRRSILFGSPNTYVVRNWLASGLADRCRADLGLEPVFVTPFQDAAFSSPAGAAYANHGLPIARRKDVELPIGFPRLLFFFWYLRMRTFAREVPNGSLQMMMLAQRRDIVHYAAEAVRRLAPRGSRVRRMLRSAIDAINPRDPVCNELLARLRPEIVVVGSPGVMYIDQVLMVEAQRLGIPVHCVVNSWDNLTSRGPMMRRPDRLMVWNRHMAEQAATIHEFPADRTVIVGALQFTEYGESPAQSECVAVRERVGLAADAKFLLYLTGQHAPEYEAEDVAALLHALEGSEFGEMSVVVRVHPQASVGPFRAIRHPRLVVDVAPRYASSGANGLSFDHREMRAMSALLASSEAVLASWATTGLLEAAIFDRPVVQLRWMDSIAHSVEEQRQKIEALQTYEHLKAFDAVGSRLFSDDPADVVAQLRRQSDDAELFRQRRRRAVDELAMLPLTDAPDRIVECLRNGPV
ncbi:MAG: hypothetical protein ACRELX_17705 [Longimicrobiales bacterium]